MPGTLLPRVQGGAALKVDKAILSLQKELRIWGGKWKGKMGCIDAIYKPARSTKGWGCPFTCKIKVM